MVNSFTAIYYVFLRINTYPPRQIWQVLARAPLRVAVGRLRTTTLLNICAFLRRGRARTWTWPQKRTPSRRPGVLWGWGWGGLLVAGGPVGRTRSGLGGGCFCLSLLPSRSFRLIRVEFERGRPVLPKRAAGRRIRVVSEWRAWEVCEPYHVAICLLDPVSSLWSPQL